MTILLVKCWAVQCTHLAVIYVSSHKCIVNHSINQPNFYSANMSQANGCGHWSSSERRSSVVQNRVISLKIVTVNIQLTSCLMDRAP